MKPVPRQKGTTMVIPKMVAYWPNPSWVIPMPYQARKEKRQADHRDRSPGFFARVRQESLDNVQTDVLAVIGTAGDRQQCGPDHHISGKLFGPGESEMEKIAFDHAEPDHHDHDTHQKRADTLDHPIQSVGDRKSQGVGPFSIDDLSLLPGIGLHINGGNHGIHGGGLDQFILPGDFVGRVGLVFVTGAETNAGDAVASHDGNAVGGESPFVHHRLAVEQGCSNPSTFCRRHGLHPAPTGESSIAWGKPVRCKQGGRSRTC
jgi:hypothetical protein